MSFEERDGSIVCVKKVDFVEDINYDSTDCDDYDEHDYIALEEVLYYRHGQVG